MSLPVFMLICLSAVQLCVGQDIIQVETVHPLGGISVSNPQSPEIQEAVKQAVIAYNKKSKSKNLFKLVSVSSATSQVTNKLNYNIDATIGETNCAKSKTPDLSKCNVVGKKLKCHFVLTHEPDTTKYNLESHKCS